LNVTKRDGSLEPINLDKIHDILEYASKGLPNVSTSQVEMNAKIQFYDGIPTDDLNKMLIKAAADLTTAQHPEFATLAGRLLMFTVRKLAYGQHTPTPFYEQIVSMIDKGLYDKDILKDYTEKEVKDLETIIDHDRDLDFAYAGAKQLFSKYLVQNRVTGEVFESPQYLYMLVSMCLFSKYPKDTRIGYTKRFYEATSTHKISLPTPIMAGVRTPTRQFSSCVLIEAADSLDSISAATSAIVKYVSQRAGIGINGGNIRALGSTIRGGEAKHTGVIPFWKHFQTAVKSCSQGGVRGGAATLFYPFWHLEVESLLVLKNNRGTDENRIRHMDYGVQLNKLMYQRLLEKGNITLFSPNAVPGMYEAFFADQELFEKLYTEAEANNAIEKKTVKATELFTTLMQERAQTARVYIQNVDHCNTHSPFDPKVATVKQSNLCVAGSTETLTSKGYLTIAPLEGTEVNVWNGEEWSNVTVEKTGVNQKLLTVSTDSTEDIECTPYHKFYVAKGYSGKYVEKRTYQLEEGDKLIKHELPLIEGSSVLEKAYDNGFYSADGCNVKGRARVYLYGEKQGLFDLFQNKEVVTIQPELDRMYFYLPNLEDKFFVPDASYTVSSRLEWLAGYLDGDGTVARNGANESLQATSVDFNFLFRIQKMLQTLGIHSKVTHNTHEGYRMLPRNDGTGTKGKYWCKAQKRLLISSSDLYKLCLLGFTTNRLSWTKKQPQRNAGHFVKISAVVDNNITGDTYCFTEPKRNMGMFNGVLAGNCLEIALPTKPMNNILDEEGEVALCTLAALNLGELLSPSVIGDNELVEELCDLTVRALDALLDYQNYPIPSAQNSSLSRRTLGIGVVNYANNLARRGLKYSDGSANKHTHEMFECIQYNLLKASNNLAKEQGACSAFRDTRYAQGLLPIDTYKRDLDSVISPEYIMDWETLRSSIVKHGLRNSTLTALMPSETSSQVSNATNGIEPPRSFVTVKGSKDNMSKQVVPNVTEFGSNYEFTWDMPNNTGYINLVGIMQKFVDQSISANTNYDPGMFESGMVPLKVLIQDLLKAYKVGVKTLYYHNTRDGSSDGDVVAETGCDSGGCKI